MDEPRQQDLQKPKALLLSFFRHSYEKAKSLEYLEELILLADTYGTEIKAKEAIYLRELSPATYISSGKLQELVTRVKEEEIDLVILDDEISPAQQRNLEKAFGKRVLDRTEIILGVFAARARTKEARLQIELAEKCYQLPRLTRLWTHLSRQRGTSGGGGGGSYLKGEGEKQIEIDRRILKDEISKIKQEIEEVKSIRGVQRKSRQRQRLPTFAIVGYTNAGKSTLLNALTGSEVLVEDRLFATLDTTTRRMELGEQQEVLVIDTVGFIRKLPHLLVAAFKGTLEESLEADILLHLVDASHPLAEEQIRTTEKVLKELGASDKPAIILFNKIDQCSFPEAIQKLKIQFPKHVKISALTREGFEELLSFMASEISSLRQEASFRVPQKEFKVASELLQAGHLIKKEYEENDVILHMEIPKVLLGKYEAYRTLP